MNYKGQKSQEILKDVIEDDISTKEVSNVKITNSNERMYDEGGRSAESLDQGDGRNEGGTCVKPKRLFSEVEQGAMIIGRGKAKKRRMIWWIGWQP